MNKHLIALPVLLVAATALLMLSLAQPPDEVVLADKCPPNCASPSPDTTPSPGNASPGPKVTPTPGKATPAPGKTPVPKVTPKPTPKPTGSPCPSPSPAAAAATDPNAATPATGATASAAPGSTTNPCNPLPSYGIAATTPDAVLREAKVQAGRVDPFKSVFPPDLPEFNPALAPEQLALPSLPPLPSGEPNLGPAPLPTDKPAPITQSGDPKRPPLEQGLALKGIMDGGVDPIAIIEVHGRTELVRVGERLSGGILVTSINFDERRVTLSRGSERATLTIPEPNSPSY